MKKFYCARLTLRIINMIPLGLSTSITLHIGKWEPILAPIFYVIVISLEFVYNKMIKKKEDNESKVNNDYNNLPNGAITLVK